MTVMSSIRGSLTAIVVAATCLAVGVVAVLLYVIGDLSRTVRDLDRLTARIELTDRLQLELSRLLVPLNAYLLTEDLSRRDAFDQSITEISRLLNELPRNQTDGEWRAIAQEVQGRVTQLSLLAVEVLFVDHPVGNPQVVRLMDRVNQLSDETIAQAARFHELADHEVAARREHASRQSARVNRLLTTVVIMTPLVLLAFYMALTRWVTVRLSALSHCVRALRSGRAERLPVHSRDEVGEVAGAINELADHLAVSREQVQRRTRQLEAVYRANQALSKQSSREGLFQALAALVRSELDVPYAALAVCDEHRCLDQVVESGVPPVMRWSEPDRRAMIATLPREERPLRFANRDSESWLPRVPGPPVASLMVIPVFAESRRRAWLYVFHTQQDAFSDEDEGLALTIAADAGQSLKVIALHEEAERLASIDGLTGFINRTAFDDRLRQEFSRAARHGRAFALVFIDLDHLKAINDRFGHAVGDAAIRRFCDAIRDVIRATDVVGRYGGDEILVLMPETNLPEALLAGNRILSRVVGSPLTVEREQVALSASIGIAIYPDHARDKEALLRAADFALYQAKAAGRGRVHAVNPSGPRTPDESQAA
ncbi:MAG: diguanylate cyclase [Nitrospirota bacterium]